MAFANLLGSFTNALGGMTPEMVGQFGGQQPDPNALAISGIMGGQPQMPQQQPKKHGINLADILGTIGDALLVANGRAPMYGANKQHRQEIEHQDQINAALANYMDDPEGAIRALMGVDPQAGIAMLNGRKDDRPGIIKEADAYAHADPQERSQIDSYLKLRFPGQMSPIVMGENDSLEMPGQPDQSGGETIAEDAQGNRVRWNGTTWEPIGGQTASPSGVFPGQ